MPLPAAAGEDKFVALVSGLSLGAEGDGASNALSLQMMIDYLAGHLGGSQDLAHAAAVVRVIVAGNSIEKRAATEESRKKGSATDITQGAQDLDLALLQLCAAVPVDMMPGETDPSQFMMPQQPLHRRDNNQPIDQRLPLPLCSWHETICASSPDPSCLLLDASSRKRVSSSRSPRRPTHTRR
jgi:hypothetical protein